MLVEAEEAKHIDTECLYTALYPQIQNFFKGLTATPPPTSGHRITFRDPLDRNSSWIQKKFSIFIQKGIRDPLEGSAPKGQPYWCYEMLVYGPPSNLWCTMLSHQLFGQIGQWEEKKIIILSQNWLCCKDMMFSDLIYCLGSPNWSCLSYLYMLYWPISWGKKKQLRQFWAK